jgi:ribosomal protein S13
MKKLPTYKHGFKMPEGYLDSFESRLQERLNTEIKQTEDTILKNSPKIEKQEPKVFSLQKMVVIGLSIAACITIFFSVQTTETSSSMDDIAITTIEDYLFSNTLEFSLDEISTELSESEIDEILLEQSISDEILEAYLLENINNNSLILE